jgi:polysaccharide export outer membrane protein
VDLKRLLHGGDLSLNLSLKPNDVIYIPDSDDSLVYVMGEVNRPGAYRLTPGMSFLDVLAKAGGPTREASKKKIHLVRPSTGESQKININDFIDGKERRDYGVQVGDIVYVPASGLSKFGFVLQKISPALNMLVLGRALAL